MHVYIPSRQCLKKQLELPWTGFSCLVHYYSMTFDTPIEVISIERQSLGSEHTPSNNYIHALVDTCI